MTTRHPFPPELRESFASIVERKPTRRDLDHLRRHVFAVVDDMKAAGAPPERILRILKTAAIEAGLAIDEHHVIERLAPWFVDRYYGPSESAA